MDIFASHKLPHFFVPSEIYFLRCTFCRREMRQKIVMTKSQLNLEEKYGKTLKRCRERSFSTSGIQTFNW